VAMRILLRAEVSAAKSADGVDAVEKKIWAQKMKRAVGRFMLSPQVFVENRLLNLVDIAVVVKRFDR
jgi:uncharacterized membrane protein YebE (DUF533 family)